MNQSTKVTTDMIYTELSNWYNRPCYLYFHLNLNIKWNWCPPLELFMKLYQKLCRRINCGLHQWANNDKTLTSLTKTTLRSISAPWLWKFISLRLSACIWLVCISLTAHKIKYTVNVLHVLEMPKNNFHIFIPTEDCP